MSGAPGGTAARSPAGREGGHADDRPRSYYGQPVLKEPVWSPEVGVYFFTGGLAGASATLGFAAQATGQPQLAQSAWISAFAGIAVSPVLLIVDLGRPERFLNMLRVFKVTSPMSVGTWIVSAAGPAIGFAAARSVLGWFPRLGAVSAPAAAVLGPAVSTYTAVLIADTAVPAWHEGRRMLPVVFASSSAASAGAAAAALTPGALAGPARHLCALGAAAELVASHRLEHGLGTVGEPYRQSKHLKLAKVLTAAGAALVAGSATRRPLAVAGGAMVLGGALATRWGIFRAGWPSAADPAYTVEPQRERVTARRSDPSGPAR